MLEWEMPTFSGEAPVQHRDPRGTRWFRPREMLREDDSSTLQKSAETVLARPRSGLDAQSDDSTRPRRYPRGAPRGGAATTTRAPTRRRRRRIIRVAPPRRGRDEPRRLGPPQVRRRVDGDGEVRLEGLGADRRLHDHRHEPLPGAPSGSRDGRAVPRESAEPRGLGAVVRRVGVRDAHRAAARERSRRDAEGRAERASVPAAEWRSCPSFLILLRTSRGRYQQSNAANNY